MKALITVKIILALTFLSNMSFASTNNTDLPPDDQSLCTKINSALYSVYDYGLKRPAIAAAEGTLIGLVTAGSGIKEISEALNIFGTLNLSDRASYFGYGVLLTVASPFTGLFGGLGLLWLSENNQSFE